MQKVAVASNMRSVPHILRLLTHNFWRFFLQHLETMNCFCSVIVPHRTLWMDAWRKLLRTLAASRGCRERLSSVAAGLAFNPYIDSPILHYFLPPPPSHVQNPLPIWETRKGTHVRNVAGNTTFLTGAQLWMRSRRIGSCISCHFIGHIYYALSIEQIWLHLTRVGSSCTLGCFDSYWYFVALT
jgi:hypothetical protein